MNANAEPKIIGVKWEVSDFGPSVICNVEYVHYSFHYLWIFLSVKWWTFCQPGLLKTKNRVGVQLSAISADDEQEMSNSTSCF